MKSRTIGGVLVLALGFGLSGCSGAQTGEVSEMVSAEEQSDTTPTSSEQPTTSAPSGEVSSLEMPNLIGLDVSDAEEALRDLNVRISRTDEASPEEVGTVLDQDPLAGDALTDTVQIVVAGEPPAVPDVVGQTFADATDVLEEQGFSVEENPVLDDAASDGEIIGQTPEVGSENVKTVTLDVARNPVSVPLAGMDVLEQAADIDIGPAEIAGDVYANSLLVAEYGNQGSFGYNLSKNYRQVVGTLGIDDNEETECVATVEFKDGGRTLGSGSYSVKFGEPLPVEFSVAEVLRLEVSFAASGSGDRCNIVFGDFRAEGLESEVGANPDPSE